MEAKKVFRAAYRNVRMLRREDSTAKRYKELLETIEHGGRRRYLFDVVIRAIGDHVRSEMLGWEERFRENPEETFVALASILREMIAIRTTPSELPEGWDKLKAFAASCTPEVAKRTRTGRAMCLVTGKAFAWRLGRYVSAKGLGDMVLEGIKRFEGKHGECIPPNLVFSDMSDRLMVGSSPIVYRGRKVTQTGADQLLREYGRIRGWLIAATDLRSVTKVIKKTQSTLGVNSPRTTLYLPELWGKYPSPGHLERKLRKVRRRAEMILSAFGDYNPSWNSIAHAVLKTKRVGKAAIIVVAETLIGEHREHFRNYAAARDFLTSIRTVAFPVADYSDGVEARREAEPTLRKLGISVYRIRVTERFGRFSLKWLVRTDAERTFHSHKSDPESALYHAIHAWYRQDELVAEKANVISFLNGDELGFCPLITREDSYEAGNCQTGTESWLRQKGWVDRKFIPGVWLIKHLQNKEVLRVAVAARKRCVGTERTVAA